MNNSKIVFDPVLMRPGCVLLQAAYGCDPQLAHEFPVESWLLAPTDNLSCYPCNDEILILLKQKVPAHLACA